MTIDEKINGQQGVRMMVMKQSGANTVKVAREVTAEYFITVAFWKMIYTPIVSVRPITSDAYRMYSYYGSVVVEDVKSRVTVYDMNGRVMETERLKGTFVSRSLKSGIYIIRVDDHAQKMYVW